MPNHMETPHSGQEQENSFEQERIASNYAVLLKERNRSKRESYEKIYGKGTGEFIDLDKRDIEYLQEIMTSPEVSSRQLTEEEKKTVEQMIGAGVSWLPFADFDKEDQSYDVFFSHNDVSFVPREKINDVLKDSEDPRYGTYNSYYELIQQLGIQSAWVPNIKISEGEAKDLALELSNKFGPVVEGLKK